MNCAGPGHLKGGAGEAEVTAVVAGRDGGGGEVEQCGNPVGVHPYRSRAPCPSRQCSGGEAAYQAERGGRAQPGCVGGGRGHVDGAGGGGEPARPLGGWGAETRGEGR